ncbi:trifunctional transcriptional regulator/proline dehydrogenase/pyrroline-5-carboxylate dehydrogenase [Caballeronia hypogeia]|uniref:Bifunctional protein PutA n=1 Tax=Caballeronia hypogeia TaxID=1777140 RepID=A0A158D8W8_9BURK|nr:bifunctional proline dehydrogenase/L-glutamate gamma-semialdehyde dehydrogenase PutA [Caballeronia hypogeia]SAK90217.1 trifunctional transcriptional regulator/proline dehydrogenase/pyrroline-5-carboxylate dehydrogenase [Caballeronia hypogeia]
MLSEIETMQTVTPDLAVLRQRIADVTALPEETVVKALMQEAQFDAHTLRKTQALAARLAQGVRDARIDAGGVDLLTQEFSLDSREGIALMCLAEAMLRIPDTQTRNQLIRDKIVDADWRAHIGKSPSLFVNATAWGLLVTGKLLKQPDESALAEALTRVVRKGGEAVVRGGVAYAMRMLGKQFVTGQTIEEAIGVAKGRESNGYRYSYDMLGEAALTDEDAQAYFESYRHAIEAIGGDAKGRGPIDGPGVSVKISGLHPRYELAQRERVLVEMYPRLLQLAQLARQYGIGFHLDQEESARFELTLEMLERLCKEPSLKGWNGIGISLQSYQKRGRAVAEWIIALARSTQRRINIRLVKGAYWDTEIKLAQDAGADGYPVFTRKVHSDVSYIACAKALLAAPDAIFPQFATHNAFTVAAVHTLAGDQPYEFQCLHGMGETVYDQVVGAAKLGRACRIYAPVGPHATLLAYLVRRLLENGANSSFVNQIVDPAVSIDDIVQDPVAKAATTGGKPHAGIVSPRALLPGRVNAKAMNFSGMPEFDRAVAEIRAQRLSVQSLVARSIELTSDATALVYGASDASEVIGSVASCRIDVVNAALDAASVARATWTQSSREARAAILEAVANRFEHECARLGALLVMEHGATLADAADEVRHAINLCRLYAYQLNADERLADLDPLGVVVSMTPVSSPLASFVGQTASALAAGNVIVAKPSSHAALIAHEAARAFLHCGVPADVLQLIIHDGASFARAFASDRRVAAVSFAGSHEAARSLAVLLARQPHAPKFIHMQSGVNAMIVDSSALPEQVISDAIHSAFRGAGQDASALRVLCLQDSTADRVLRMLKGMLTERVTGDPLHAATDMGPLATRRARDKAEVYIEQLKRRGFTVVRGKLDANHGKANYVAPTIVDLGDVAALDALDATIGGPILHVVRYRTGQMEPLLKRLNALGAGVQGLHTRINEAAGKLLSITKANSVCVNRAMHGAFAGMQPYGGVGAAGTGPMNGGPLTLLTLSRGAVMPSLRAASGPFAQQASVTSEKFFEFPVESTDGKLSDRQTALHEAKAAQRARLDALFALASAASDRQRDPALWSHVGEAVARYHPLSLPALTGEENTVELLPRGQVLCVAESDADLLTQVMIASGFGNDIVMPKSALADEIARKLGACARVIGADDVPRALRGALSTVRPDVVLARGAQGSVADVRMIAAEHMIPVIVADASGAYDWSALVRERVTTVNASAAGGNTQLMVMSEDIL